MNTKQKEMIDCASFLLCHTDNGLSLSNLKLLVQPLKEHFKGEPDLNAVRALKGVWERKEYNETQIADDIAYKLILTTCTVINDVPDVESPTIRLMQIMYKTDPEAIENKLERFINTALFILDSYEK